MSTPLRRINSFSSPRRNLNEREHLPTLRDLPKSRYATCPCLIVFQPRRPRPLVFSHIEVYKMVESIATELREAGVRPQTVCAFVLPNCIEAIVYFLALQWIGAIAVPVDPALDKSLLSAMLTSVSALTVVSPFVDEDDRADDVLFKKVSAVCESGNHVHWMIDRSTNKGVYMEMCGRRAGLQSAWAGGAGDFRFEPTDPAFHLPSIHPVAGLAIQISHGDATDINRLFVETYNLNQQHSTMLVMPLHSVHGLMAVLTTLTAGGSIVIADMKMIDSDLILKYVSTLKLNWLTADTKTLVSLFTAACMSQSSDLRTLQFIRSVGGLIGEDIIKQVEPFLGGQVLQSYGTTETCGLVTTNVANENFIGTFGKPVDKIEICIFDENERTHISEHGVEGLIGVFGGHVNIHLDSADPSEKGMCFAHVKHSDGDKDFFLTGDKGHLNENGCLVVTSLTSCETDSEALAQILQKKATMHEQQLEEAARELEQKRAEEERERQEAAKRELLAAEEAAAELKRKEEEQLRELEEQKHKAEEEEQKRKVEEEEEQKLKTEDEEQKHKTEEEEQKRRTEEEEQKRRAEEEMRSKEERNIEDEESLNEKPEDEVNHELEHETTMSSDSDSTSRTFIVHESEEEASEDENIDGQSSSDASAPKKSDAGSNRLTEGCEEGDNGGSQQIAREIQEDKPAGDVPSFVLNDLLHRMSQLENRQSELEEELRNERAKNAAAVLKLAELNQDNDERVSSPADSENETDSKELSVSQSKTGEERDNLVSQSSSGTSTTPSDSEESENETGSKELSVSQSKTREERDNLVSQSSSGTSTIPSDPGDNTTSVGESKTEAESSNVNLTTSASTHSAPTTSLHTSPTAQSSSTTSRYISGDGTSALFDSSETQVTSSKTKASSTANKSSGTQTNVVSTSSSPTEDSDKLEDVSGLNSSSFVASKSSSSSASELEDRLNTLEEAVHKLLDEIVDNTVMEEMMQRIEKIEANQSKLDTDMEKGHRLEMEKLHKLVDQMEATHMKQAASLQRCASAISNIQHNQPKQIPPTLDVEELARAVRQAAASAAQSSRDTTAAAGAAKEAADAAKSAADAHAALLRKSDDDGTNGILKKTTIVCLDRIEKAMEVHPAVEIARAFGRKDRNHGAEIYVALKLKSGARVSLPWLVLHAQSMLPAAFVPKRFYFKPDLHKHEERAALAANRELANIATVTGITPAREVKSPAWAPLFKPRKSKVSL